MRQKNQRGNVFIILFVVLVLVGGLIYWQQSKKTAAKAEAVRLANAAKQENEAKVRIELEMLKQQVEAAKPKDALQVSLKAADDIYARWKDGKKIANLTGRINLATPVASLQALRREAENLIVPDCLKNGKTNLLEAMKLEIDGFLAFMGDVNFGKLVAQANADTAEKLLVGYEADRSMCPN